MKLYPLPHYFEISNLPSIASAIQTNDLSQDMILQHDNATPNKINRYKSCNNHFTWNFCTIHPRCWNYFTVLHIHIARACTHMCTHAHTVSYKPSPILYTNSYHFSWIFHAELQTMTLNSHSSVTSENQKHVIKNIWLKVMRSIVFCSLVHISQDTFIQARLQEAHTYVHMM